MIVEEFVQKYGEHHRMLITSALNFLDEHEGEWNLEIPIDREEYIHLLIAQAGGKVK